MRFPVNSINSRKLRSHYGKSLLGQASSEVREQRKPIYERIAPLASLTGLVVGFVAALGFPAAILQFIYLGIPTEMLSYGRALRAGIVPTTALVIGVFTILRVGKLLSSIASKLIEKRLRRDEISDEKDAEGTLPNIALPFVLVFGLWFLLVWLGDLVAFFWWPFIILRYITRSFSSVWTIAAILIVVAPQLVFWLWYFPRNRSKLEARRRTTELGPDDQRQRSVEADEDFIMPIYFAAFSVLGFGALHLLAVYTFKQVLQALGIYMGFLTMQVMLLISALWGLVVGAIFFWSFSIPAFASKDPKKRRRAWAEIVTLTLLAYLTLVIVYSMSIYWRMPDSIGGGKPQPVSIWIDSVGPQLDLSKQLPQAKCTLEGQQWLCTSAYLLNVDGETVVLVDSRTPNANSLVISQRNVQAFTRDGNL